MPRSSSFTATSVQPATSTPPSQRRPPHRRPPPSNGSQHHRSQHQRPTAWNGQEGGRARHPGPPTLPTSTACLLRLRRRRDRDRAAFDVELYLRDLCLHVRRDLRREVVVRRQAGPVVREGADVASAT